jgi:hypothetical protein
MDMFTASDRWLALCDQLWDVQDALDCQRSAHHARHEDQWGCAYCDSLGLILGAMDTYLADAIGRGKESA